jgi:hypothetical protein
MLAADSVAINRLQVKGDKRTSQALVRELEQTSWPMPLPAHLQQAWILVRELQVKGKARDLRQQTAQHLDSELQTAVRAIHGNPTAANAIWFASLPELIAFLVVDLALGKATQWYWYRWSYLLSYPKHEAIARLLCEHCEHLPAVIMQLQSRQQLHLVWRQLSDGSAKTIARELLRVWSLPGINAWEPDADVRDEVEIIRQALQTQTVLLSYWRPLLRGLVVQDGRVLLAAVLHGLIYAPLWLQQQPTALVQSFAAVVCSLSPRILTSAIINESITPISGEQTPVEKTAPSLTEKRDVPTHNSLNATESFTSSKDERFNQIDSERKTSHAQKAANRDLLDLQQDIHLPLGKVH